MKNLVAFPLRGRIFYVLAEYQKTGRGETSYTARIRTAKQIHSRKITLYRVKGITNILCQKEKFWEIHTRSGISTRIVLIIVEEG